MSAPSAKQRGHVQAAFVEGVTALLRRALTERFGFRLTVDGKGGDGLAELLDDDGVVMMSHRLAGVQLALPLGAPASSAVPTIPAPTVEPSQPPPTPPALPKACAHTWERIPSGATEDYAYSCWECHTVVGRLDDAFAAIDERYRRNVLFEATPVIPPIAPAGRMLRAGDAVHAPDGSTWVVRAIEGGAVYLSLDGATDGLPDEATVARDAITLDAADLWRVAAVPVIPEALAPGVSQVSDGHLAGVSETPEAAVDKPAEKPWTLFSIEVPERFDDAREWAESKGLAWVCGGYLIWGIEGGATRRAHHRMVAIVPSTGARELLDRLDEASFLVDMSDVDYGDTLLRVGSLVRRDSGQKLPVTSITRAERLVEYGGEGARFAVYLDSLDVTSDGSGDFKVLPSKPAAPKARKIGGATAKAMMLDAIEGATKPSQASKKTSAPKVNPSKIPESSDRPAQRVVIVHDQGADSLGARKGLAAWSAEKTPGAGSRSGGDCRPLVMLHTPLADSPEVEKLLGRYAKAKRPVLDLGVVAGEDLAACLPSLAEIRERWNATHPLARVTVPEAPKAPRAKKGGARC